ncbi:MAG: hypothetical protein MJ252_30255 [archaeon]|nr:hypothetical protein [archaeon]
MSINKGSKILSMFLLLSMVFMVKSFQFYPWIEDNSRQKGLCGKFICNPSQKDYCAKTAFEPGLQVTLNNICASNEYCDIGGTDPNDVFYQHKEIKATCKTIPLNLATKRYPGEECLTNDDCIDITEIKAENKCVNKQCVGLKEDQKCKSTEACSAGLFCESKSGRCKKQRAEYDDCTSSYQCENGLLCYQSQCRDILFSLPVGTKVEQGDVNGDFYCEYGLNINGVCAKLSLIEKELNEPLACTDHNVCEYQYEPESLGKVSLNCECGYNADGLSYCPISHNYKSQVWKKYFTLLKLKYNNECHTYSRYNCYQNYGLLRELIANAREEMVRGSRYHNAVDCAIGIFKNLV